jgi:hypothetical protein
MNDERKPICVIDADLAGRLASGLYRMADLLEETFQKARVMPVNMDDVSEQVMACIAAQDDIMRLRDKDFDLY